MNKKTRQFIVGLGGTFLFSASLGTQIRTLVNNELTYTILEGVWLGVTIIFLAVSARMLYKTI